MKNNIFLFESIGSISDCFVEEAALGAKQKNISSGFSSKWGTAVACLLMLVFINVIFIYLYKWNGTPADTGAPAATDTDTEIDVKESDTEDDTVPEPIVLTNADITAFSEPCLCINMNIEPHPTINNLYPDDFVKGDLYMSHYLSYKLSILRCDTELEKNVTEKKENITFLGETKKVVYSASYGYSGNKDEAYQISVYDSCDEYKVYAGGLMRVRSDGTVVMMSSGIAMEECSFSANEGREIADEHLLSILGTQASKYELITENHTNTLYSAYYSYTIDGVHTTDVINILITGDGELFEYSAYDLGRFVKYDETVTKELVNAYMSYSKEKLKALGLPEGELSEPMIGEYNGELYIITDMDEISGLGLHTKTYFHIKIEE